MNKHPKIKGVIPVIQMAYRNDDSIDYDILQKEVDYLIGCGVDGIALALGSELVRLTQAERLELTEKLPRMVDGRVSILISVGAESARGAAHYAEEAEKHGADAVMAVPPIMTVPDEEHLFEYYETIFNSVSLPLLVQNAGDYTGHGMAVKFLLRIREELGPRIYFKPETQPIGPSLCALQEAMENKAIVFDGNSGLYMINNYRIGITGILPGSCLIRAILAVWRALEAGDDARAYRVYFPMISIIIHQLSPADAGFGISKYLLMKLGIFKNRRIRQPSALELDTQTIEEIDRLNALLEKSLEE